MKRAILIAMVVIAAAGLAAPQIDINFMRPRIERAIEAGLGRKVEVGKVYINLLTGPGFTVEDVTIHEDARAGIEPMLYVQELEARVRLLSLFSKRLEFSSLRLHEGANGEKPTVNLVKTAAGPWNFQFLLNAVPSLASMPAINIRGGRINFKFADTKSVFYFSDADLDVSPSSDGSVDVRFSGSPARTDQPAQNFGHFFVRGKWTGQQLDMRVELERSGLDETARLFDQHGFGLHGVVAFDAQLSGPPSKLDVVGTVSVDDVHRWDLLPKRGGGWSVRYKGSLDLRGERLEFASTSDAPDPQLGLKFRAWDFLSTPHWEASADMNKIPLATLVEVARHMGAPLSDKLAAEGAVSGSVRYGESNGLDGQMSLQDASVTVPDTQPLHAAQASVTINGKAFSLDATTVKVGENETADLEGRYEAGVGLDLRIATKSLNVADLRTFGLASIPVVAQSPQGTLRGWVRYQWTPGGNGDWAGEFDLQNARIPIDGFSAPLRLQSASVSCGAAKTTVSRIRARIGEIPLSGEYRWDATAARQHRFKLAISHTDGVELQKVLAPTLLREGGFFARTLRLGAASVPDWLSARHADGQLSIDVLDLGDIQVRVDSARVIWDGTQIRLAKLLAHSDPASTSGELTIDLTGRAPAYRFAGKLQDVPYKSGRLDLDGNFESSGSGEELLASARAEGSFRGRSIAFSPDAEFRTASGCFELSPGLHLRISCIEATQGGDTLTGTGATQPDGRLVLDLINRGRAVRYSSAPASGATQP
jgi:AsmA protein